LSREDQIQAMLRNSILIGIVAFVVLAALLVVALRRPREKVVQLVERYSRSMRGGPAGKTARASQGAAQPTATDTGSLPRFGLTLDGYDTGGNSHKIQIDKGDLLTSVTVGREPPDSRFAIHNDEVSRSHASLYAKDGLLYVRDEGSTNGTFLNGRTVRPNYSEIAGNGDELKFGPVTMKILFR
jgi:FHA domain